MKERIFQGMEYVYEVYKAGSFRQAAENLYISQPSLSASVRRVEARIGTPIFDRSTKPLRLTECGERYVSAIKQVMALENEFVEYMNDWDSLLRGKLVLGGSSLFSSLLLPSMLSQFQKVYPGVQIELIEQTTGKLETMLQTGAVDMIVDYELPQPNDYEWTVLENEHLLLSVPASLDINAELASYRVSPELISDDESAINNIPPVPLELFKNETFILLKPENDSRRRADILCAEHNFHPKMLLEFDQQMTSYLVSCSGMGICFASSMMVRRIGPDPNMIYYHLSGDVSRRQICLFWKKGRYFTRAMEKFRKLAEEESPF